VAEQMYKDFLPSLPMDGKISLPALQDYLDQAQRNNELTHRVDVNTLVDYSLLDEVLKEK
jgi:hypothetical protein